MSSSGAVIAESTHRGSYWCLALLEGGELSLTPKSIAYLVGNMVSINGLQDHLYSSCAT